MQVSSGALSPLLLLFGGFLFIAGFDLETTTLSLTRRIASVVDEQGLVLRPSWNH